MLAPGSPWNSPGQSIGVDSLSLLQGIFPTQGSNPGLPHCRWVLYQLSHNGTSLSKLQEIVKDRESWGAAVLRFAESDAT